MNTSDLGEITILDSIKNFITPLTKEELYQLESNILANGCKDPLTIWKRDCDNVLIDGHHRYDICKQHNIDFEVEVMHFDSYAQVQIWMVSHQMGRRNLSVDQLSYYRGKKYLLLKRQHGGFDNVLNKGIRNETTSKRLAGEFKVAESTIKRDAKYAEGLELIGKSNQVLKTKILSGESGLKKSEIQFLSDIDEQRKQRLKIKNEADLVNKIAQIRKDSIEAIEDKLDQIEKEKVAMAQAELQSRDSMFLDQDQRLDRLKGRIISAINEAIRTKNLKAIDDLKVLVDRLQKELSMIE